MFEVIQTDCTNYEDLWETNLQYLKAHNQKWNRFEASDPGITILEMFTLLFDMQNFYRDQVEEKHKWQLLRLLGIRREGIIPAAGYVTLTGIKDSIYLPAGTRFYAGAVVFETRTAYKLHKNKIKKVYYGINPENDRLTLIELAPGYIVEAENAAETGDESIALRIELEERVPVGGTLTIFVKMKDTHKKGNGLGIQWLYESAGGIKREAVVCQDSTGNLQHTGIVVLRMEEGMEGDCYEVTAKLIRDNQAIVKGAVLPEILDIRLNTIEVQQTHTLAKTCYVKAGKEKPVLKNYLTYTGKISIYEEYGELWREADESWHIHKRNDMAVIITGKNDRINYGKTLKIVCMAEDYPLYYKPAGITGGAVCTIELDGLPVLKERLGLQLKEEERLYREYKWNGPEGQYGYSYDEERNCIVFGDGRNYRIPKRSMGGLLFTNLVLCQGAGGNVAAGKIKTMASLPGCEDIQCTNIYPCTGGRDLETLESAMQRAREYV